MFTPTVLCGTERSNPNCAELSILGTNSGGNEVVYQLIKVTSVKTKPREMLTMRARRRESQAASPKTHSSHREFMIVTQPVSYTHLTLPTIYSV